MDIRIQHAEVSVTINDQDYVFDQAISIALNDPRTVTLLTSPQGKGSGIPLAQNLTQPVTLATIIRDMPVQIEQALNSVWSTLGDQRIKFMAIDKSNGKTISVSDAVITANPNNRTIDEAETSRDYPLNIAAAAGNVRNDFNEV